MSQDAICAKKMRIARYSIVQQQRLEAKEQEGGSHIVNALDALADAIDCLEAHILAMQEE